MKRIVILIILLLCASVQATNITKSQGELMDWTLLDDTGGVPFLESALFDSGEGYDDSLSSTLLVTMVNVGAAGTAGAQGFAVYVRMGATDETWRQLTKLPMDATASTVGDCNAASAAAQANINLTATTGFETPGSMYFLHDAGTIADSALVIFGGVYNNDNFITVIDNLVNTYDADDNLYSNVQQWSIVLPGGCDEAKVLFYNGDADANYACRVDYANQDEIE